MADVNRPLVELCHHQDGRHRLPLGVRQDWQVLGPLLKVLPGTKERERESESCEATRVPVETPLPLTHLHPGGDVVHLQRGVRVVQVHLQAGRRAGDRRQNGGVVRGGPDEEGVVAAAPRLGQLSEQRRITCTQPFPKPPYLPLYSAIELLMQFIVPLTRAGRS